MGKLSNYFQKYGIGIKDIPMAFICFKSLSVLSYFGCMAICYRYKPLITLFKMGPPKKLLTGIQNRYPNAYYKTHTFVLNQTDKLTNSKIFQRLPKFGANNKRLSIAIAENIVFSKLMIPVFMPLQFWITIHMLKSTPIVNTIVTDTPIKPDTSIETTSADIISTDLTIDKTIDVIVDTYNILFTDTSFENNRVITS